MEVRTPKQVKSKKRAPARVIVFGDVERMRGALQQMAAIGGDVAWLAELLGERVDALPQERLRRRDAAYAALAATMDGSTRNRAQEAIDVVGRYAAGDWKRRDCRLDGPPLGYASSPAKTALFWIMRETGEATPIDLRQVNNVLRKTSGNREALPISQLLLDSEPAPSPGPRDMNFALPHTDRALLDAVRVSPIGRDLIAAEVKQTMAARRKLIAEIDALDAKAAAESPKHERAVAAAIDDVRAAEAALRVANDRLRDVGYAKSQWSLGYTLARQRLEQELRNGADGDAIDAFIRDMHDDQDLSRKAHVGGLDHQTNPVTRKASLRRYTNAKTVFARIEAAKAAIDEAERLRLSADQSAVRARLAELRAKLPAIGEAEYLPS